MTAYMAKSGESGDSPAPKEALLPAGHPAGHHGLQAYTGNYIEVPAGTCVESPYHYSKYPGLGPKIAAGVFLRTPPVPVNLDLSAIAGRFSNLQSMALSGDTTLEAFRPPVTRIFQPSVVVQSPRDYRTIALIRNYMRKARVLRAENLEALIDKRIDKHEKKKLEAERLLLEEERRKFEEEKRNFELEKKLFPQKKVAVDDEKKETKQSLFESTIDTADKHVTLFEKIISIPQKGETFGKTITENAEVILKKLKVLKEKRIPRSITSSGVAGIYFFKEEMKEWTGMRVGESNGESNAVLNVGNGKVTANGFHKAGNGGKGASSTGVDPASSTGVDPASSTGVDPASSTAVAPASSTAVAPASSTAVAPASPTGVAPGVTGAQVGGEPKVE
ncbi:hypothetical protein VPH35_011634 [Triticum aestivum]|uniref:uncharacterized protein n=1 Tax=Triticum aestivum TaxID=4565 RepID=UPI001D02417D|nr:uncharacterized protein LOC123148252 [Triticum aestivum]